MREHATSDEQRTFYTNILSLLNTELQQLGGTVSEGTTSNGNGRGNNGESNGSTENSNVGGESTTANSSNERGGESNV